MLHPKKNVKKFAKNKNILGTGALRGHVKI